MLSVNVPPTSDATRKRGEDWGTHSYPRPDSRKHHKKQASSAHEKLLCDNINFFSRNTLKPTARGEVAPRAPASVCTLPYLVSSPPVSEGKSHRTAIDRYRDPVIARLRRGEKCNQRCRFFRLAEPAGRNVTVDKIVTRSLLFGCSFFRICGLLIRPAPTQFDRHTGRRIAGSSGLRPTFKRGLRGRGRVEGFRRDGAADVDDAPPIHARPYRGPRSPLNDAPR